MRTKMGIPSDILQDWDKQTKIIKKKARKKNDATLKDRIGRMSNYEAAEYFIKQLEKRAGICVQSRERAIMQTQKLMQELSVRWK